MGCLRPGRIPCRSETRRLIPKSLATSCNVLRYLAGVLPRDRTHETEPPNRGIKRAFVAEKNFRKTFGRNFLPAHQETNAVRTGGFNSDRWRRTSRAFRIFCKTFNIQRSTFNRLKLVTDVRKHRPRRCGSFSENVQAARSAIVSGLVER